MMKNFILLLVLSLCVHYALGVHDLTEEYRFSAELGPGYNLHWSFDLDAGSIAFAVNVSTTGWVGFGLSPNGQMPGSDVVIGWVQDNGLVQFKDRYAPGRYQPSVDLSQDWVLVSGEERNGNTILEFTRNLTSCDVNDLNIEADTARVIWSYHSDDPTSDSSIPEHEAKGSASLNLLGGLAEERVEPNSQDFSVLVNNVTIPAVDTTYWCVVSELPIEVREQERYIYKISSEISVASSPYVHHIVIYLCRELNHTHLGSSDVCDNVHIEIGLCRAGSELIAAWAVGGSDFIFPPDVALPLGGPGGSRYIVIEMHYDNPSLISGIVDESGIKFTYSNSRPVHEAGLLTVGAPSSPHLIVPPGMPDFTITAFCSQECTQMFLPPEGIKVFGNMLHTHLAGHGLVVDHFTESTCGLREQLQPIDENRRYDFNYQQFTNLPRTVTVLPGDEIQISCFYKTSGIREVTLGGESTREEMCISFLYYYPKTPMSFCTSFPDASAYQQFASQHIDSTMHANFSRSLLTLDRTLARPILNTVEWNQDTIDSLRRLYLEGPQTSVCTTINGAFNFTPGDRLPSADCNFVPPNTCTGEPGSQGRCCQGSGGTRLGHLSPVLTLLIATILCVSVV